MLDIAQQTIQKLATPAGRIILGVYFLLPGLMKFTQYDMHVEYMASHGMVFIPFFLILSGIIQVSGAIAFFVGYQVRLYAFLLAGMTVIICSAVTKPRTFLRIWASPPDCWYLSTLVRAPTVLITDPQPADREQAVRRRDFPLTLLENDNDSDILCAPVRRKNLYQIA